MTTIPPEWTQMNFLLPKKLHHQLRILAAANQRSMNGQLRHLIEQAAKKELKAS